MKLPITQHKQQFQMYYYQEDGEATANCYASQVPFSAILSSVYTSARLIYTREVAQEPLP